MIQHYLALAAHEEAIAKSLRRGEVRDALRAENRSGFTAAISRFFRGNAEPRTPLGSAITIEHTAGNGAW